MNLWKTIIIGVMIIAQLSCAISQINQPSQQANTPKIFFFQSAGFSIASIDGVDQPLINSQIKQFENDMDTNNLDEYSAHPYQFSIQLLSGSEGNHFLSTEDLSHIGNVPQPAQAIVLNENQKYMVFKGEFDNGQFYSAQDATISTHNKTYLLTLNLDSQVQAFQGKLLAGTDGNHLNLPDVPQPVTEVVQQDISAIRMLPLSIAQVEESRQVFQQLKGVQYDLGEGKTLQVNRTDIKHLFGPPPPPKPHIKKNFNDPGFPTRMGPPPPPPGGFNHEQNPKDSHHQRMMERKRLIKDFYEKRDRQLFYRGSPEEQKSRARRRP